MNKYTDDYALMQRIAKGDREAFTILFDREMLSIYRLAFVHLSDQAMAEDVTQETLAKLWTHAESWKPEAKIRTWLLSVARNRCIDQLRKRKNHWEKQGDYAFYFSHLQHSSISIEEQLIRDERVKKIDKALFLLPERQKEAVSLVYKLECSGAEAASIMGLSISALESLLARARRKLKQIITNDNDELRKEAINDI